MLKESDKERILRNIVIGLSRPSDHRQYKETVLGSRNVYVDWENDIVPQFIYITDLHNIPINSIVRCNTNPNHICGIARYQGRGVNCWILREIGSNRIVDMYNESLSLLIGMPQHMLLEGFEYKIFLWAKKALQERYNPATNQYNFRFRDAEILDKQTLRIYIGPSFSSFRRQIDIKINKKTRLKDIIQSLIEQNFNKEWTKNELAGTRQVS